MSLSYEFAKSRKVMVWMEVVEKFKDSPQKKSLVFTDLNMTEYLNQEKRWAATEVEFVQKDCVYAAIDQKRLGMNPLLLNMASDFTPGGGVKSGCAAQEEELFRRSDYFLHLSPTHYPLSDLTNLVSEKVYFYRLGAEEDYGPMRSPTEIDCVAAAAVRKPATADGGCRFAYKEDRDRFRAKIRRLFLTAQKHGNDCLVLSAWGCGAFRCPLEDVARLFREVVAENEGKLRKVVFAIHDLQTFQKFRNVFEAK